MSEIYIRSRGDGKVYVLDSGNLELKIGDQILFESDQCQEIAKVISKSEKESLNAEEGSDKAEIIRRLNERDLEIDRQRKETAQKNLAKCQEIVKKHTLPMEILDADLSYYEKKMTFYFSAPGRVDFRSLVSELASNFHKLIRLQQVGARDRARFAGGIGRCGQDFCCKRFLKGELECVSVDMAYDQNLGQSGSNRVTGACGKLMCCLKYELDFYKSAKKKLPEIGKKIKCEKGEGIVISQNVIQNKVTVVLPDKNYVEVEC